MELSLILFYLQNLSANHRANDRVTLEGQEQTISARFMYGPLDMVSLSGEKVGVTNKVFARIQSQNHLVHILTVLRVRFKAFVLLSPRDLVDTKEVGGNVILLYSELSVSWTPSRPHLIFKEPTTSR